VAACCPLSVVSIPRIPTTDCRLLIAAINPLPLFSRSLENIHTNIYIIEYSGMLLVLVRPEHPAQILDEPPAEPYGCGQKQTLKGLCSQSLHQPAGLWQSALLISPLFKRRSTRLRSSVVKSPVSKSAFNVVLVFQHGL
jgi:hypothetical protein